MLFRSTLYNLSDHRIKVLTNKNDASISTSLPWEKMQEPCKIYNIVQQILDAFISKYEGIRGIGFTGQMHGILYIDRAGRNLSPLIIWQDGRGNLQYRKNLTYASFLSYETGYKVASGFGLVTHFFDLKNNRVPKGAWKICTIMDYVDRKSVV